MIRVCTLFLLLAAFRVWGHAILVEASPAKDAVIDRVPETVQLRFDAPVGERYLAVAVIDAEQHERVDAGDAHRDLLDPSIVQVHLNRPLKPGAYVVRYRVQSADGHIVTGRYRFTIAGVSHAPEQNDEKSLLDRLVGLFADR